MDRAKLITKLIDREIEINGGDGDWYLRSLLEHGVRGYDKYSDEELRFEAESVGIDPETAEVR